MGRDAGHPCQPVFLVLDRWYLDCVVRRHDGILRRVSDRHPPVCWFGSRLFPIVAAIVPVALILSPYASSIRIAVVILVDAILLAAVAYVVRSRDYP